MAITTPYERVGERFLHFLLAEGLIEVVAVVPPRLYFAPRRALRRPGKFADARRLLRCETWRGPSYAFTYPHNLEYLDIPSKEAAEVSLPLLAEVSDRFAVVLREGARA